ncbi:MAG: iron chelate uptake ABC transporter family permease subunit [Ndongobacter sp.]|nr:iron chelate uptake ABC transporter family permease subunit [Ndongobacter sp.]
MELLQSYSFQVIALGTMLLAAVAGVVGCFSVYRGQSLIGDAVGHASFPGVLIAFILFQTRAPGALLAGAIVTGAAAYLLIQTAHRHSKIGLDACLAIFLSGSFGLGMVLKSMIQGNPDFSQASQSGLSNYIFGQASYMLEADVLWIEIISLHCLALLLLFYKELKLVTFDPAYADSIGISTRLMNGVVLLMTIALIGVGLKAVGAILISSFLVLPCVAADQWTHRFSRVLLLSALFGAVSALLGTVLSTVVHGFSTGPSIILVCGSIALLSMLFGTRGALRRALQRRRS